ncbi:hypothetical protein, partial [Arsukibacterium sp.]|uniref:hypothetical protein n=1 Tax=Arsukibacterium sp. TaxID=1977258 RepID=UPI002FDA589B
LERAGAFLLVAIRAVDYSRMAATALRWWHCAGLPWPASLRDLPAAVQKRSRRFCRHATSLLVQTLIVMMKRSNKASPFVKGGMRRICFKRNI